MVNRVHTALASTLQTDEIYSILLATLVSRSGLDFSRAMLFEYSPEQKAFQGRSALGPNDQDEHDRLHREEDAELTKLRELFRTEESSVDTPDHQQTLIGRSLRDLASQTFWVTIYQRFGQENQLLGQIRPIRIPWRPSNPPACLKEQIETGGVRILQPGDLAESDLPPELTDLLPGPTMWAPVKTRKGVEVLLVADRIYDRNPFSKTDCFYLEWLVGQAALALENARMYNDLQDAYTQLRELDDMKSNFLATISHELRTPLTAINGFTQLLVDGRLGELRSDQKEIAERVLAHSQVLTGKVSNLIEIAELDAGRTVETTVEPTDPLCVLDSIISRIEPYCRQKDITLEKTFEGELPLILSNREALARIFYHLLDNAVKFGLPNGHVWIDVQHRKKELAFQIRDDGIGSSRDQLRNIFNAFFQVDQRLTRSYNGLGLGLTIAHKCLDMSGGRMEIDSEPGAGSTFTVVYPIA